MALFTETKKTELDPELGRSLQLIAEAAAGRMGISPKAVYARLERWRRRIGAGQPELAAWLGEGR